LKDGLVKRRGSVYIQRRRSRHAGCETAHPKGADFLSQTTGKRGAIAQLGERFNGIEEVVGSIPSGSTIYNHVLN
jgi:hypothetical protein